MAVLSTLTIETTTQAHSDHLNPSLTTKNFKEIEEPQEITTHKMRKVLKHIYKRPIHPRNGEKINKQDVLLNYRDSGKDLLMAFEKNLTDVNKSDVILLSDASTIDSSILNKEYNKPTEKVSEVESIFSGSLDNYAFETQLKIKENHQLGEGKCILYSSV